MMKRRNLIGTIAVSGLLVLSSVAIANPTGHPVLHALQHQVAEAAAAGSWVCAKCGFHIVTKSGNPPAGGSCFKNNNGSHTWERGD